MEEKPVAQNLLSGFGNMDFFSVSEMEFDPSQSTKMYTLTELKKCIEIPNDRNFEGKFAVKAVI